MPDPALQSLQSYSELVTELLQRADVERSTVAVWSDSPYTGVAEGEVFFSHGHRLRLREEIDFADGLITSYGYEVYRANNGSTGTTTSPIRRTPPSPPAFPIRSTSRRTSSGTESRRPSSASSGPTCRTS